MQNNTSKAAVASKAANIKARSAAAAKAKSGVAKRKPSKDDIRRKATERAIASANKRLESITLEEAREQYVRGELKAEGLRNVFAMALNNRFAKVLEDHRLHWSIVWESKTQRHEGSNLHPIWKAIDLERAGLVELLEKGNHSNPSQVWKRVRERAYQLAYPGQKRAPRQPGKLPADSAIEKLIAAYKAVARETVQSERDEEIAEVLGRAIVQLKLDIEKINQSIG